MPLLSICIPTFERPHDLESCLQSIFSMDATILDVVEVCISDNCSTYDFCGLMKKFEEHNNLIYRVSAENLGFDKNMLEVARMATGQYVMFMGNDDKILSDGALNLIKILGEIEPDAVFSNYEIKTTSSEMPYNVCSLDLVKVGLTLGQLLEITREKITFISSIVIKRDRLVFDGLYLDKFIGKQFIHIAMLFECLSGSSEIVYSPYPVVQATDRNKVEYDVKQYFLYDLGCIINSYSALCGEKVLRPLRLGVLTHVFFAVRWFTLRDLAEFRFINIQSLLLWSISKSNVMFELCKKRVSILAYIKSKISQLVIW